MIPSMDCGNITTVWRLKPSSSLTTPQTSEVDKDFASTDRNLGPDPAIFEHAHKHCPVYKHDEVPSHRFPNQRIECIPFSAPIALSQTCNYETHNQQ